MSILEAELLGIQFGLEICKDLNWNELTVESDSQTAITLILSTSKKCHWPLTNILQHISSLSLAFNVTFTHSYREGNRAADRLAANALSNLSSQTFSPSELPVPLRKLTYLDKIHSPQIRHYWEKNTLISLPLFTFLLLSLDLFFGSKGLWLVSTFFYRVTCH